MNQVIYILVDDFSNNKKEAFFENELPYICSVFKKVYVISLYPNENKVLNYNAANLEVLQFNYFAACNRVSVFRKNFRSVFKIYFSEFAKTHNKGFYLINFRFLINQLVLTFSAAENLERFIKKDMEPTTLFYCYWFKQWAAALSIIKMYRPELKFVSRVHGGDYDEDQIKSTFPFRYFQLANINRVFPVSEYGRNYLINKFKVNPSKIITARLGLSLQSNSSKIDTGELHFVSCSSVIPLKRVHLIVEILKHVKTQCSWTHFGDGPLLEDLKQQANLLQCKVEFKGYVPNAEFIDYLKTGSANFFINVSESEGIPVSMMEAIANGIPLIGTAVCGVPEIVTNETGILLTPDFTPAEAANLIEKEHISGKMYTSEFRAGIIKFCRNNFSAEVNSKKLTEVLATV